MTAGDLERIADLMHAPRRAILALHPGHDGDSIASNLAMARVLREAGHHVDIVSREQPRSEFSFLPGWNEIRFVGTERVKLEDYDVFWALDMSAASRDGIDQPYPPELVTVVLDHHSSNPGWGHLNIVQATACSTTAVLWEVFSAVGISTDETLATILLTGLATDTEFFAVASAGNGFEIAAKLVAAGADYGLIDFHINRQMRATTVSSLARGLQGLRTESNPAFAFIVLEGTRNSVEDARELATTYVSRIAETDFGVVLSPAEEGQIRLELRSHLPSYDVSVIAAELGGGGHRARSGVSSFEGSFEDALNAVREAARQVRQDA